MAARKHSTSEDSALSLALAIVKASSEPLVLLGPGLAVIAVSTSFCDAFGLDLATVLGRRFRRVGSGEWANPRLDSMLEAMLAEPPPVRVLEMDLYRPESQRQRLVITAERLVYLDEDARIVVAVSDVTQVRADRDAAAEALEDDLIQLRDGQDPRITTRFVAVTPPPSPWLSAIEAAVPISARSRRANPPSP